MFKETSIPDQQYDEFISFLLNPTPDPNGEITGDVFKMALADILGVTPERAAPDFHGVDFMDDGTAPTPEPDFIEDDAPKA